MKKIVIPHGDDFSSFPKTIINIIEEETIEEIWCICGPGSFTRMRIITLVLNTLHLSKNIVVKWCHFFDLIQKWIPILEINTTEYIIKDSSRDSIVINKEGLAPWVYSGYISKNDFTDAGEFVEYKENCTNISEFFGNIEEQERLSPIYYKNPHITCSKKNISLFSKTMKK